MMVRRGAAYGAIPDGKTGRTDGHGVAPRIPGRAAVAPLFGEEKGPEGPRLTVPTRDLDEERSA